MGEGRGRGNVVGVSVLVHQMPPKEKSPEKKKKPIEDVVREAIERIDDGCATEVDFLMLKRLKLGLQKLKPTPRVKNLITMIDPAMRKFGYYF